MKELVLKAREFLKSYDGQEVSFMEICGSHTNALSKTGIRSMLSPKIKLISGPGCPVCVTPTAYIDRLVELADEGKVIACFGDLIRVPGSMGSLQEAVARGGQVRMMFSPAEVADWGLEEPDKEFIVAAVGFETTVANYSILLGRLEEEGIENVRLLTSVKTMPQVVRYLCDRNKRIDGFLAPGHVAAVTGWEAFEPLAREYKLPFVVAGFSGQELLVALYALVLKAGNNTGNVDSGLVVNCYPSVVNREVNSTWKQLVDKYFEPTDAYWRGFGIVEKSGLVLRNQYKKYDAGSYELNEDKPPRGCSCGRVLLGEISPNECPLFGRACRPESPVGACMVSEEGSCQAYYRGL